MYKKYEHLGKIKSMSENPLESLVFNQIKQHPIFDGIVDKHLRQFCKALTIKELRKKDYLFHKGDKTDSLFINISGRLISIDENEQGHLNGLNTIDEGEIFCEDTILGSQPITYSVMSVSNSLVACVPKNRLHNLMEIYPTITHGILRELSLKLKDSVEIRGIISISDPVHRISKLLFKFAKPDPGKLITIENMPTHEQIAIIANTSRETVSRVITMLIKGNIIEKDNKRIILRDVHKLINPY